MPKCSLIPAPLSSKPVLENLMHLYLYDFSEYTHDDVDEQGRFTDEYLPRYWTELERCPFLVTVDGKYAGFVLVRQVSKPGELPVTHSIAEFFIIRKYRRHGVGRDAAWQVFDRFSGRWIIEEMRENLPAQAFWRKIIDEYTQGNYCDTTRPDWDGPVQEFERQ
jgi:predicted acetyltransferase